MKKLSFDYRMTLSYSEPVTDCHFTIKCIPRSDDRQQLLDHTIELEPYTDFSRGTDSFGNLQLYGSELPPHSSFTFHISGNIGISQILYEEKEDEDRTALYRHPYGLGRPGPAIKEYFDSLNLGQYENTYEKSVMLMHTLHQDFSYEAGVTDINTSAEEAFLLKRGVCQDYTHIYIALSKLAGIPCRYVSGMISGEGQSHAWAEVLYHKKWIGLDPTNDRLVAYDHIKLSHGRDARDCMINRGVMKGGGTQTQLISVSVTK